MRERLKEYLDELNKRHKKNRRAAAAALVLAVLVVGSVAAFLEQYGVAMTGAVKCGQEEHQHSEDCYQKKLACGLEEREGHAHTEACYTPGELVCGQEESEGHIHTEECRAPEKLACGLEESEGHTHTEECHTEELTCGREEHVHTELCYTDMSADVEDEAVWAAQYGETEWSGNWGWDLATAAQMQLGYQESTSNYIVTEDGSHKGYSRYGHFAGDMYTDWDAAFVNFCMYYAGLSDKGIFPEKLTASEWYDALVSQNGTFCVAQPPFDYEPEAGDLVFFRKEGEETESQMGIVSSYHAQEQVVCVIEGNSGNEVRENQYDAGDDRITAYLMMAEAEAAYQNTKEADSPSKGDEDVGLTEPAAAETEGVEEPESEGAAAEESSVSEEIAAEEETGGESAESDSAETELAETDPSETELAEIVKTFEDDRIRAAAAYTEEAGIPEEAEFAVEQITPENDAEHYAQREAQYQELMGEETRGMRALLKIGFYVDGVEVEPKGPVSVTIQFLDENGLEDGNPITVVHFADDTTEVLEGSKVKNGETTFNMDSFSEIAIGYGKEEIVETKAWVSKSFEYEDAMFRAVFHIEGEVMVPDSPAESGENRQTEEALKKEKEESAEGEKEEREEGQAEKAFTEEDFEGTFVFAAEPLEEAEGYQAAGVYGADAGDNEIYLNQVLSYYLLYNDEKLDLSECTVTMEAVPAQILVDYSERTAGAAADGSQEIQEELTFSIIDIVYGDEGNEFLGQGAEAGNPEATEEPAAVEDAASDAENPADRAEADDLPKGEILAAESVTRISVEQPLQVTLKASGTENAVGARAESQANPEFTVEFYAYIDMLAFTQEGTGEVLPVIDTTGGNLPVNGGSMPRKWMALGDGNKVQTTEQLVEIYSPDTCRYITAPGLVYFNKIAQNSNYILKEIQVLRKDSTEWESYSCENGREWHFTNKQETKEENPEDFILITSGATIRLIHDVNTRDVVNGAEFYDYDISDGAVYNEDGIAQERGDDRIHETLPVWYMYTNRQGINSNLTDQTFGFGNGNVYTGLHEITGNKANEGNAVYGKATFGLVTGLQNGRIQYAGNVIAPALFGDGSAQGKTEYGGELVFSQKGDTYTLTAANVKDNDSIVSSVTGLDQFKRSQWNWNKTYFFAANDFYPLDGAGVKSAGYGGHDLMFGSAAGSKDGTVKGFSEKTNVKNGATVTMPASDDQENHNHYFGMHYTVTFDLTADYVGPLEYLFYGDDDMWVFLSQGGQEADGQLVCDIGGVHSAVGEYVNLWDYIEMGTEGTYTLSFYYTERGASGSTCWMQFTLPSVSFSTTEQDTGQIRIEKEVTGSETDEEFGFEIQFKDAAGNPLRDDYSYTKYDAGTNEPIEHDILIWNNSKFTLKANQYIIVSFLPEGSSYTISEIGPVEVKPKEPGEDVEWEVKEGDIYDPRVTQGNAEPVSTRVISGTISKNTQESVHYNNVEWFELPSTGGPGTVLYTVLGMMCLMCGAGFLYRARSRGGKT